MPTLRQCLFHASTFTFTLVAALLFTSARASPPQTPAQSATSPAVAPPVITTLAAPRPGPALKALFITGGCCHDYKTQMNVLTEGISKFANVQWTCVLASSTATTALNPFFDNPDWAKGYDAVIHDECTADVKDADYIRRILKPHKDGIPAVVLHCAMHTFRNAPIANEWREFLGVTTHEHEAATPLDIKPLPDQAKHGILTGFPETFRTPVPDEMYIILKTWPNTTPLATGYGKSNNTDFACIWTSTYGKARIFGTTLGHDTAMVKSETYIGLIARGLLWSANKLTDNGQPVPDIAIRNQ